MYCIIITIYIMSRIVIIKRGIGETVIMQPAVSCSGISSSSSKTSNIYVINKPVLEAEISLGKERERERAGGGKWSCIRCL